MHTSWKVCLREALQFIPSRVFKHLNLYLSFIYILPSFLSGFPAVKRDQTYDIFIQTFMHCLQLQSIHYETPIITICIKAKNIRNVNIIQCITVIYPFSTRQWLKYFVYLKLPFISRERKTFTKMSILSKFKCI